MEHADRQQPVADGVPRAQHLRGAPAAKNPSGRTAGTRTEPAASGRTAGRAGAQRHRRHRGRSPQPGARSASAHSGRTGPSVEVAGPRTSLRTAAIGRVARPGPPGRRDRRRCSASDPPSWRSVVSLLRRSPLLITAGALGVAVTTALEVVTAPYSPAVARLLAERGRPRREGGRHRRAGPRARRAGRGPCAMPASGWPRSPPACSPSPRGRRRPVQPGRGDAGHRPDAGRSRGAARAIYAASRPGSGRSRRSRCRSPCSPSSCSAVVVLRHRLLPAWAPIASLAAVPVAVLAGVLGDAGWVLPHPPAWLFLGLAAYGPRCARRRARGARRRPA